MKTLIFKVNIPEDGSVDLSTLKPIKQVDFDGFKGFEEITTDQKNLAGKALQEMGQLLTAYKLLPWFNPLTKQFEDR